MAGGGHIYAERFGPPPARIRHAPYQFQAPGPRHRQVQAGPMDQGCSARPILPDQHQ